MGLKEETSSGTVIKRFRTQAEFYVGGMQEPKASAMVSCQFPEVAGHPERLCIISVQYRFVKLKEVMQYDQSFNCLPVYLKNSTNTANEFIKIRSDEYSEDDNGFLIEFYRQSTDVYDGDILDVCVYYAILDQ